jgi:uroporphyrinogen decarboxylase
VPVIVFAKGVHHNWAQLAGTGARVLGVDAHLPLTQARQSVPETIALQGNLDPQLLVAATPEAIGVETRRLLEEMRGRPGYVFNLGHGVPPAAKLENIGRLVATVRHPL